VTVVLFWTASVLIAFAIALAAQMRVLISYSLRRALAAQLGGNPADPAYRAAILMAGRGAPQDEAGHHLLKEYPVPLAWLAMSRRVSLIGPFLLLLVVLAGRYGLGVF
jgi:hypothetical protein